MEDKMDGTRRWEMHTNFLPEQLMGIKHLVYLPLEAQITLKWILHKYNVIL